MTNLEASEALALVGSHRIDAGTIVTNVRWASTLIEINAGWAVSSQHISRVTDALEAPLEVVTHSPLAHPFLFTFIDIWKEIFPFQYSSFLGNVKQYVSFKVLKSAELNLNLISPTNMPIDYSYPRTLTNTVTCESVDPISRGTWTTVTAQCVLTFG